jgi:hypothetical protein
VSWAEKIEKSVPFPPDLYKMKIDGAGWDRTKSGKDRLTVRFLCLAGRKEGQFFNWQLVESTTPGGIAFFLQRLSWVGVTADWLKSKEPTNEEIADFIKSSGDDYMVTVELGEFNGQPQAEVAKVARA